MSSQFPARKRLDEFLLDIRHLPSSFCQMSCLAALRDPNTAIYSHPAIGEYNLRANANREFRLLHERIFHHWLNLTLEEQKADLDVYLSSLACDRATVIRTWTAIESYRGFMPATASTAERQLFLSNLETLLRIEMADLSRTPSTTAQPQSDLLILTIKEASVLLRVPARTLRLWAELGEIPAFKVGRQWRLRRRDIEEWLVQRITPKCNR